MKKPTFLYAAMLAVTMTLSTGAGALDFAQPIKQLNGEPMRKDLAAVGDQKGDIYTLNDAVQLALLASYPDEQNIDGVEKNKRFWLAKNINDQRKDPALSAEDVALIKKLVAKAFNPLVVGRVWELIDPASAPK